MDFSEKVFTVCRSIPWGKVVSYGQIALLCGSPRQARRVGYVLGHVQPKKGEDIPAHRVLNSQGYLSGAEAFPAADSQRLLLESEGVCVSENQRVDLKKFGWLPSEQEIEALRRCFEGGEGVKH